MSDFPRDKRDICCRCSDFYVCCSCYDCTDFKSCERYGTLTHGCTPCRRFSPTADFEAENKACRDDLAEYHRNGGNV